MAGAISITASAFSPSALATINYGIAGATITQGQPLYIDTANSNVLKLADSNTGGLIAATVCGLATQSVSAGQRVGYVVQDPNLTIGSTQLAGNDLWLFTTAGTMTVTASDVASGSYAIHLGNYTTTTTVNLLITIGGLYA